LLKKLAILLINLLLDKSKNSTILNLPDKRLVALLLYNKEESPGSTKTRCQVMPGGGNPRDSATENKPPYQGKGEKVW